MTDALIAAIEANPDDRACAVYADWLLDDAARGTLKSIFGEKVTFFG